ncbi:MAG: alpha/beta hydrolase [Planctomycetaceae bacterium]
MPEQLRPNFGRVDTDGDGKITPAEHQAFLQSRGGNPAAGSHPTGPRVPETVIAHRDVPYAGTTHARQTLDLYLPKAPSANPPPLVVFIHGGGWQGGDKAGGAARVLPLVETGEYAAASIGYRLSGDATWPVQIHDCKAAIRWLRGNAKKHGYNADRIGVIGTSAGGHLVAMLGTSGDVTAVEGDLGEFDDQSSRVQCVVDYFGPSDLVTITRGDQPAGRGPRQSPITLLLGGPLSEKLEQAKEASPATHITPDDPPFLILHGTDDPVVPFDQSVRLDELLRANSVDCTFVRINGGQHGGFDGPETNARVRSFLDRHLLDRTTEVSSEPIEAPPRRRG